MLEVLEKGGFLACGEARSSFLDKIKEKKFDDERVTKIRDSVLREEAKEVLIDEKGVLIIKGRIFISPVDDITHTILVEVHSMIYSIHPSAKKMYRNLRQYYCGVV